MMPQRSHSRSSRSRNRNSVAGARERSTATRKACGVGVDAEQDLVYGKYEHLDASLFIGEVPENFGCTSDATPHAFLVAVHRSLAPASEFRLRLRDERLCEDCGITWDEIVVRFGE